MKLWLNVSFWSSFGSGRPSSIRCFSFSATTVNSRAKQISMTYSSCFLLPHYLETSTPSGGESIPQSILEAVDHQSPKVSFVISLSQPFSRYSAPFSFRHALKYLSVNYSSPKKIHLLKTLYLRCV